VDVIVRFATENLIRGFDRIQGTLQNIGYHIAESTVVNILQAHCIEPVPHWERMPAWSIFLKLHWCFIFAADFTTVEVWTRNGLVTFYFLTVIHLKI
jgi:hypothetical protein